MAGPGTGQGRGPNLEGVAGPDGDRAWEGGPTCKGWQGLEKGQDMGAQLVRGGRV